MFRMQRRQRCSRRRTEPAMFTRAGEERAMDEDEALGWGGRSLAGEMDYQLGKI